MPTSTVPEKPGSTSAGFSAGTIGTAGTDFFIKVLDASWNFSSPTGEATGDGDDYPVFENSGLLYGEVTLNGYMVAAKAIELKNLVESGSNPVSGVTFQVGGTQTITHELFVEAIGLRWDKKSPWVGVSLRAKVNDTDPSNIEN